MPSPATCALPITAPVALRTMIAAPTWPVPDTLAPSTDTVAVGAPGVSLGIRSGAVALPAVETLPAASAWVSVRTWPLVRGGLSVTVKLPSRFTGTVARISPTGSVIVTVAPISPMPFSTVPSADTVATGASGGVRSSAVTVVASESFPAASAWVTLSTWLLSCGVDRTTE